MAERTAFDCFTSVLAGGWVHSVAADLDELVTKDNAGAGGPTIFRGLRRPTTRALIESDDEPELFSELVALSSAERAARIREVVYRELAASLGYSKTTEVDPLAGFQDLGVDSLTAMRFQKRLNAVTGMQVPSSVAVDYANPAEFVEFVLREFEALVDSNGVVLHGNDG
jgi:hypothetical protein